MPVVGTGELMLCMESLCRSINMLTRTVGQTLPDAAGRQRVVLDAITGALTLATVTNITNLPTLANVTTLATLSNQTNIGGFAASEEIPCLMRMRADTLRRNIQVS
jgi:hypothetical protein